MNLTKYPFGKKIFIRITASVRLLFTVREVGGGLCVSPEGLGKNWHH